MRQQVKSKLLQSERKGVKYNLGGADTVQRTGDMELYT